MKNLSKQASVEAWAREVEGMMSALGLDRAGFVARFNLSKSIVDYWLARTHAASSPAKKRLRDAVALALAASDNSPLAQIVAEFSEQLHLLASYDKTLDMHATLRKVLKAGFIALSPDSPDLRVVGVLQSKHNREGHLRAGPRRKAK